MILLRAFWYVRVCSPQVQTYRLFSGLQVRSETTANRLWKPSVNKVFVRWKLLTSKKSRTFRPQYGKDQVSEEFQLIYENNMNKIVFWSQLFIYAMTIPTVIGAAAIVVTNSADIPSNLSISHPAATAMGYFVFGSTLILFINAVSRRSIRRIYLEPFTDRYVAIVQNWLMIPSRLHFQLKDTKPRRPTYLTAMGGNIAIKKRPFFVVGTDFKLPVYYNQLMAYDLEKPLEKASDFDLLKVAKQNRKKKEKFRS
ncbi:uncharacterized protein LOC124283479 [Haliotis rubra]|uniref:uncharacterized protein LOC124283479 n=1 Tax=Haliotis rubra TaxID=36100 RepID=UPI001EE63311|nr:uncharacterized protein LOC124283479 [Haliotis rubra]XP_046575500.1 uncharacterized protein LOC124283479 [Haliotis rubra]